MSRRRLRAVQGLVLALGAPLGWAIIRRLQGAASLDDIGNHLDLYLYLLLGTTIAFVGFGAAIGWHEDRIEEANEELVRLSLTDDLTGLRNARYFRIRLDEEAALSERQQQPLAIVILDLDHFKDVNDRYGHPTGDHFLAETGRALASATRRGETAARVGGEEFAFLLPGSNGDSGKSAAERLRQAVASVTLRRAGSPVSLTASAGVASTAETGSSDPRALYGSADQALYRAKQTGRDRVVVAERLTELPEGAAS